MSESFDEEFCSSLERCLHLFFAASDDPKLKWFWCDGIIIPYPNQLDKKFINDKRKLTTKAFVGMDGQTQYEMIIRFGRYSLRRYAKGRSLMDCLPVDEFSDWIKIDAEKKIIELQLR